MTAPLANAKAILREQVRARLKDIPAAERASASAQLVTRLLGLSVWKNAKSVLLFSPFGIEPDICPLIHEAIASGKLTALPGFDPATQTYFARFIRDPETDLVAGEFGILEPRSACEAAPLNRLDLVLVPGVAFDTRGRRLGRGKGYYDRLLTHVRGTKCGIAFDEQIVEEIPAGPLDIRLNCILTPTRWTQT